MYIHGKCNVLLICQTATFATLKHQQLIQTCKRFERTLIYYDTDTQPAYFGGNPLCQATKRHLTVKWLKTMKSEMRSLSFLGLRCCFLVQCLEDCWHDSVFKINIGGSLYVWSLLIWRGGFDKHMLKVIK